MKVKEKSEKACLKLNIQKTKVMASGPMTNRMGKLVNSDRFILGGSKITAMTAVLKLKDTCSLKGKL